MAAPSAAERARTAVACARVAALTTYPAGSSAAQTLVQVEDDRGDLLLHLSPESPVVRHLGACPLATVRVAPAGCSAVTGRGCVRRLDDAGDLVCFRLRMEELRVQPDDRLVAPGEYGRARPDPLREEAPGIVRALRARHGAGLAACLRAHGHAGVHWAEPLSVDRYGLELAALREHGVDVLRLDFPAPLHCLADLGPEWSVLLGGTPCSECGESEGE